VPDAYNFDALPRDFIDHNERGARHHGFTRFFDAADASRVRHLPHSLCSFQNFSPKADSAHAPFILNGFDILKAPHRSG
jgi:hypothetical protein